MILAAFGPGLMVMLADTDAGSVITAAQSGAQWGYRMVLPQLVLIPILFLVQEMTVRLGIVTGKGHGELIREHFGWKWAWLSVGALFVAAVGALVTEFSGIAGVSELFGIPRWLSVGVSAILLAGIGVSGNYKKVERIGIAVGLLEVFFIPAALLAHPHLHNLMQQMMLVPLGNRNFLFLLAANVGAVIMPWMVFYQQGAVIDKHLRPTDLPAARRDTLFGSVLTQVIMIAIVVAIAATLYTIHPGQPLASIGSITSGLAPFLGWDVARWVFGLGMLGASFVAALVVSVAGAWGVTEAIGCNHSLNAKFSDAKVFYILYTLAYVGGALLVLGNLNLVKLNIDVEVMNAMLLPIVLGFLLALEAKLPTRWRMVGRRKWVTWGVSALVMCFGVYMALVTLAGANRL
ncbi:divalent metal cation transporter [Alicyclobacillaceae bacterium I2511]|nr:divalent metal cation transporter [Alicyclobacillaceae bacterium I2511]